MELTIITPQGIEFNLEVDDWTPINRKEETTEIGLAIIDEKEMQAIKNTLRLHSIPVAVTENCLLILKKPIELKHDPIKDTLYLKYN